MGLWPKKPKPPEYEYWYLDDQGQFQSYGKSEDYHEEALSVENLHGMTSSNIKLAPGTMVYSSGAKAQALANSAKPGMREGILKKFTQENNKSIMMREAIRNQISKGAE